MPFKELHRRDSWPPTILHLDPNDLPSISEIDDNPFSYFLTSADDLLDFDLDEDLSAGIESPDSPSIRAVSPSSLQRSSSGSDSCQPTYHGHRLHHPIPTAPLSLRDFSAAHTKSQPAHHKPRVRNPQPTRGRRTVRLAPAAAGSTSQGIGGRGRGQTRSLSAPRRPHSWREPSPDVWSIAEGDEDAVEATAEVYGEQLPPPPSPPKKKKKTVRFLLP